MKRKIFIYLVCGIFMVSCANKDIKEENDVSTSTKYTAMVCERTGKTSKEPTKVIALFDETNNVVELSYSTNHTPAANYEQGVYDLIEHDIEYLNSIDDVDYWEEITEESHRSYLHFRITKENSTKISSEKIVNQGFGFIFQRHKNNEGRDKFKNSMEKKNFICE